MRTVWKFPLALKPEQTIELPKGAVILFTAVPAMAGEVTMWALIGADREMEPRRFAIRGTGHEVEEDLLYVGTVIDGSFVWHIFEHR